MTEGYSAKRCSRCGATWKGTEPLPVVCPECDGPADDHEHQFPEVIIEGDRVLFPCLLCSLPALDAIAQMKAERAAEVVSQPPQEGWQPIATAPKDASWVLVLLKDGDIRRAHWASDLSGSDQPAFQGWFIACGNSFIELESTPTHWAPIPASAEGSIPSPTPPGTPTP